MIRQSRASNEPMQKSGDRDHGRDGPQEEVEEDEEDEDEDEGEYDNEDGEQDNDSNNNNDDDDADDNEKNRNTKAPTSEAGALQKRIQEVQELQSTLLAQADDVLAAADATLPQNRPQDESQLVIPRDVKARKMAQVMAMLEREYVLVASFPTFLSSFGSQDTCGLSDLPLLMLMLMLTSCV